MKITKSLQKKLRSEWLKALESGRFKQTKGRLRGGASGGGTGYCCLGVACKVFEEVTGEKPGANEGFSYADVDLSCASNVADAFGFISSNGAIDGRASSYAFLTNCNDGCNDGIEKLPRLTFKQIASLVRKNMKKVFVDVKE